MELDNIKTELENAGFNVSYGNEIFTCTLKEISRWKINLKVGTVDNADNFITDKYHYSEYPDNILYQNVGIIIDGNIYYNSSFDGHGLFLQKYA